MLGTSSSADSVSGTSSSDCLRALPPLWGFYEAVAWIMGKVGHSLGKNSAHWASLQTGPLALAAVATGESKPLCHQV